ARQLATLAAAEPVQDDLHAEPHNLAAYVAVVRADGAVDSMYSGPAYRFPDPRPGLTTRAAPSRTPLPATAGRAGRRRIRRADLHVLRRLAQLEAGWDLRILAGGFEGWEPMIALVADEAAVSLCFSARLTAYAAEAGVETLQPSRGRGFAPLVV